MDFILCLNSKVLKAEHAAKCVFLAQLGDLLLPKRKLNSSVLLFSSAEEAYQSGQGVLVHCQAGVSRSATIVIAYLMKHTLMTMTDAYKYVRSRRPVVSPNLNFMGQLLEFERDLNSGVTPRILMPKLNGVETQV